LLDGVTTAMDPLLELRLVNKHYGRGPATRTVLRDVSLTIEAGELVTVWGKRRSGRSTLLRVAAGIVRPDSGIVRFADGDLASRRGVLGDGIGYCQNSFLPAAGRFVHDQLTSSQLARGVPPSLAAARTEQALDRCDVKQYAGLRPSELKGAERTRVSIARALTFQPRLIVIDEPTLDVDLLARDEILLLLHSLADDGIAVLTSAGDATGLADSDRTLALGDGRLRGRLAPAQAEVLPLRPPAARRLHA